MWNLLMSSLIVREHLQWGFMSKTVTQKLQVPVHSLLTPGAFSAPQASRLLTKQESGQDQKVYKKLFRVLMSSWTLSCASQELATLDCNRAMHSETCIR